MPHTAMRFAHLAVAALVPALAGCLKSGIDNTTAPTTVTITAYDTVKVGSLTFQPGSGLDVTAPGGADVVTYRNTTTRNFQRVGIALVGIASSSSILSCTPILPILVDSSLRTIAPNTSVTIAQGLLPRSMNIYVTQAVTDTGNLAKPIAGRWSGTLTEFRGGVASGYPITVVSNSDGGFAANSLSPAPVVNLNGTIALPKPTTLNAWPNDCDKLYHGDPTAMSATLVGDTLSISARTTLDANASGNTPAPDSIQMRWVRRP